MQGFVPRDAFVLKIQSELCNPKYVRNVSELSRNGPAYDTPPCCLLDILKK